jgi:hypothetical protein
MTLSFYGKHCQNDQVMETIISENQSQFLFVMFKLCTNKNHSYKHNEQINNQNIDNSECFGVKFVKIYPEINLS